MLTRVKFVGSITEPSKNFHLEQRVLNLLQQPVSYWQLFLYKELSERNTCGFERMSAMNTKLSHEYSDFIMNMC